MTHQLARMTYAEVEALLARPEPKIALLPTGSTEAHGPHLPLATDSIIAEEMARRAAEQLSARGFAAVCLPPLHYAVTDWAADFAGSAGISKDSARAILLDLARRCAAMGFDATVLVNAHLEPDNIATLREVTREFAESVARDRGAESVARDRGAESGSRDRGAESVARDRGAESVARDRGAESGSRGKLLFPDKTRRRNAERLTAEFQSGSCHAGQYETSLVLAVDPTLVRSDVAAALPEHRVALHEHIARGAKSFGDCGLDQAYCGAPAQASAEEGHRSYDALAMMVVDAVLEAFG